MAFPAILELSALSGSDGFRLDGYSAGDRTGWSVASAGDVNGDGLDDLIIGAPYSAFNGSLTGSAYVVFGQTATMPSELGLLGLTGSDGFRIDGTAFGTVAGTSVASAGDFNGDGYDDLLIGAPRGPFNGDGTGSSYLVFGGSGGFPPLMQLSALTGSNGFRLDGKGGASGYSVASAGDVNGDGYDDLIIGAPGTQYNGGGSGSSYVVFGTSASFGPGFELSELSGSDGFRLDGEGGGNFSGSSVASAGDVNGDGYDDLIIGAPGAIFSAMYSGSTYVVFGKSDGFAAVEQLSELSGSNGFRLDGVADYDRSGSSVASAGDVNGDGYGDIIIGAWRADPDGESSGSSYVVFGKSTGFPPVLQLADLSGPDGFRIDGASGDDRAGYSVASAGDVNGDGFGDLIIGAPGAGPNGLGSGASYVVFGKAGGFPAVVPLSALSDSDGFRVDGAAAGDGSGRSVSAAGDFNGDGAGDLIIGAAEAAPYTSPSGAAYVLLGRLPPPPVPPPHSGGGNRSPDASDDGYSVRWNTTLRVAAPGVLANDADPDADRLWLTGVIEPPARGVLSWSPDGGFVYAPNAAFVGEDSFVYGVADGRGGTDTATVRIAVLPDPVGPPHLPVSGGFGDERLPGTYRPDTIDGGGGADTIWGGGGRDLLSGGSGDDRVYGEGDEDVAWGGEGNDLVDGGFGNDWVLGDRGDDTVLGGPGNDHAWGGQGDDLVLGGAGDDVLAGGLGDDTLDGGEGRDLLQGGAGGDVFRFSEEGGLDRVLDFDADAGDRIAIDTGGDGILNGVVFASFADILARLVDGPDGAFLWLVDGPDPVHGVTLVGIGLAQLREADFVIL